MTSIIPASEKQVIQNMSEVDAGITAAQMLGLLSAIAQNKNDIDSMVLMLEKQPWYKKCIYTLLGKNKATISDIQEHRDKLATYTSEAIALLYSSSRMQQSSIIALGESVNLINGLLASTNVQLLETQNAINDIKRETVNALRNLGTSLNTKIESVDNFHLLIEEINQGKYNTSNNLVGMFVILSQIDQRTITDTRKLDILINALLKQEIISEHEHQLAEYMLMLTQTADEYAGIIYQQVSCRDYNSFFNLFANIIENYVFLPRIEKRAKNNVILVNSICIENSMDPSSYFTSFELFQYFLDSKKQEILETISNLSIAKSSSISKNVNDSSQSTCPVSISYPHSKNVDGVNCLSDSQMNNIKSFPNLCIEDSEWLYYIKQTKCPDRREAFAYTRYGRISCTYWGELYKVRHDGTGNQKIFNENVCAEESKVKYNFKIKDNKLCFRDIYHRDRTITLNNNNTLDGIESLEALFGFGKV